MSGFMMIDVPVAQADFAADGGADGYIQVASNASFYPGATAWVRSAAVAGVRVIITDLVSTNKIGVRLLKGENAALTPHALSYGRSDMSAYTLADNSRIFQEASQVRTIPQADKRPLV